ncbi:hypothetical protein C8F04DRAFT_921804, partial [Mycena alexandri]
DLLEHVDELAAHDALPTLEDLLGHARVLRECYATQGAYERSLDKSEHDDASQTENFPEGLTWTPPCAPEALIIEPDKPLNGPQPHKEPPGFDGDRVLSNSIIFLREFGWWIEMNYAIPEGDVGRLLEIMKINIFTFAGTANQNYVGYMLDLYVLLQFECSPDLKDGLLDNLLFNLEGGAGDFVEADITQEWFNRWLEEVLLRMYKDEELHQFRSGRSMGHAAVNCFDRGYERLDGGKMKEYVERSTEYATLLREMELLRSAQ